MNWKRHLLAAVIGSMLLLARASMWGQATASASLGGTVVDKTGAVIPKADVSITNKETGATRTATTDGAGEYRFDPLSAGIYNIKVTATRFSTAEAKDVEVLVSRTVTQNLMLTPGAVSETVEVTSAAPVVDQTKTDVSLNITPEQIQNLPLNSRDIADLAYLAPGVKAADSYDPTKNRYSILSVNGQPTTAITSIPWWMMRAQLFRDQSGSLIPQALRYRAPSLPSSGPDSPFRRNQSSTIARRARAGLPLGGWPLPNSPLSGN